MPNQNIFQQRIRPVLPRILQEERIFVYVPKASGTSAGIAYFPDDQFTVSSDGKVTLKWPMSLQIENDKVNDPLETIARSKLSSDEFVHTDERVSIKHPVTGATYSNTKASLKFKRTGQDLYTKPGFIMVSDNDFEKEEIDSQDTQDAGRYVKYTLKKNNPLDQPSLVKLNRQDFAYDTEATIRWPYADNIASGTNRTNGRGLVKIEENSAGYLKFNSDGYLQLDKTKLLSDTDVKPTYGADTFEDKDLYVTKEGYAKRDQDGHILLKLTKDAIGLGNVANKAFEDYVYDNFGSSMKEHFIREFDKKLDKTTWNELFSDWQEPSENTVQKIITDLRDEDESIRDAMRTNRQFLGFFEDAEDLKNTYKAGEWTFGSTAYVKDTKSYWRVRPSNVNKVINTGVPTKADVPDDAIKTNSYRVGIRDNLQVYQWNGSIFELTRDSLHWVDIVVANAEDIQSYIEGHASEHFFTNFRIGCRETNKVMKFDGNQWIDDGNMYYEWADTYITTLSWNTFIETDPNVLKPDGTANVGTSGKWVSSDHVHPTDQTRLAKSVFDNTIINVTSDYNDNSDKDFTITLLNGGTKQLNIPYTRVSKYLHNWNGQSEFLDTQESLDKYWAGKKTEYEAQKDSATNGTMFVVDDNEGLITEDLISKSELSKAGITIDEISNNEKLVILKLAEASSIYGSPVTIVNEEAFDGNNRYVIKSAFPVTLKDKQLLISKLDNGNFKIGAYDTTDTVNQTILGFNANGSIIETKENDYVKINAALSPNKLVIATNSREVKSLTSIDEVDGGIIVADGNGAIKSISFTESGKLLQTSGSNGEILAAAVSVNSLVRNITNDFNTKGIVVSTGTGTVERKDLGELQNRLIVSDGANDLKVLTIPNESLLYINNSGEVTAFPATTADNGKVLMVQSNGKFALQTLPQQISFAPVASINRNVASGTKLSFGKPSQFEEGVLYLW